MNEHQKEWPAFRALTIGVAIDPRIIIIIPAEVPRMRPLDPAETSIRGL
jgi:hypothetical protein